MSKNVDISSKEFRRRLVDLRRRRGLSRREVAEGIGVSARAYTNWETGRQRTAMEYNVLRLAEFLEVDFDYLVHGRGGFPPDPPVAMPPRSRPRRGWWRLPAIAVATVAVIAAVYSLWPGGVFLDVSGTRLVARDAHFNFPRWRVEHDSEVSVATTVECHQGKMVLSGLSGDYPDTGQLVARRAGSGKELWSDRPNFVETSRVFGPVGGEPPGYGVRAVEFGDVDGDGHSEVIARFGHELWYPSYVRTYRCDGTILGTYYNCGAIYDMRIVDLDGDDKDEIIVAATNNGRAYQGATLFVLDEAHLSGASSDSLMMADCPLPDSSLVRVVFPAWDERYMALCGGDNDGARLSASKLKIGGAGTADARIAVDIVINEWPLVMTLDGELNPLRISPSDTFQRLMDTWSLAERREFLQYLEQWLLRPYRYGALAAR